MMFSRLTPRERLVPNLVVARRVIEKMVSAAQRFVEDETGEAMVGLLVPGTYTNGIPTLYVLDTISPDESAIRQLHTFQQGDERQDEQIWWLQENWRAWRERQRQPDATAPNKWDVPLRYLGDWHRQPGTMIQPSGGDLMTALGWIDDPDNRMSFLLAPIVTLDHPSGAASGSTANFVTVPQANGTNARIDFWYIDQTQRLFLPIAPTIYPDSQLPTLPGMPWHLASEDRAATEFARISGDGLNASVVLWDADDQAPLEVCLLTARAGADYVLLLATPWDYPTHAPTARLAPCAPPGENDDLYDVFAKLWAGSKPLADPPGWQWTPQQYLIDYLHALEAALNLKPDVTPMPAAPTDAVTSQERHDELGQS